MAKEMTAADKRKGCGCLTVIGLLGVAVVVGVVSDHSGEPSAQHLPETSVAATAQRALREVANPALTGRVLPFTLVQATRNLAFKNGPDAFVSAMVKGGSRADWAATAVYLSQAVLDSNAETGKVDVSIDNPWGDRSPTAYKSLAEVYINKHPKAGDSGTGFDVFLADKVAPLSLIEFSEYSNDLADMSPSQMSDKERDRLESQNDKNARAYIIKKYGLPKSWRDPEVNPYGTYGEPINGNRVQIAGIDADVDQEKVENCLQSDQGTAILKGCLQDGEFPHVIPDDQRHPPVNYNASNILMADIKSRDMCQTLTKYVHHHPNPTEKDQFGNNMFFTALMVSAGLRQDQIKGRYMDLLVGTLTECEQNPNMTILESMKDAAQQIGISDE